MENIKKHIENWNDGILIPGLATLRKMADTGNPKVLVAILDTPINGEHETLKAKGITDVPASSQHGTHIASIVAGSADSKHCTYKGVAPSVSIISVPIYAAGVETCNKDTLAHCIHKACDAGAHIINISGGQFDRGLFIENELTQAVKRAVSERRLIVSAAGNDGSGIVHAPAYLPGVLGVGAADWDSKPMPFSNYGGPYKTKTILAPGQNIPGADSTHHITLRTGTSFATPIVSGVAALVLSYANAHGLGLDALSVGELILKCSEPAHQPENIPENRILAGRLNLIKLIQALTTFNNQSASKNLSPTTTEDPSMSEELPIVPDSAIPSPPEDTSADVSPSTIQPVTENTQEAGITASSESSNLPPSTSNIGASTMTPTTSTISPNSIAEPRNNEQKIFAMGTVGFDFQIAARQDYFLQRIINYKSGTLDERFFQYFVESNSWEETELLTWVLKVDGTPVYALKPIGVNLVETYKLLASCLYFQLDKASRFDISSITTEKQTALLRNAGVATGDCIKDEVDKAMYRAEEVRIRELTNLTSLLVDWVAISGSVVGETTLFNGDVVPTVSIGESGIIPWDKNVTIATAAKQATPESDDDSNIEEAVEESLSRALNKIYYEFKNNGVSEEERALNYVGTNILSMADIFADVFSLTEQGAGFGMKYEFDSYEVSKSKVQRPTSILMDVILRFFEPGNLDKAYKCYRFTVDVSDVNPVLVGGKPKQYFESSTRAAG